MSIDAPSSIDTSLDAKEEIHPDSLDGLSVESVRQIACSQMIGEHPHNLGVTFFINDRGNLSCITNDGSTVKITSPTYERPSLSDACSLGAKAYCEKNPFPTLGEKCRHVANGVARTLQHLFTVA